jgi:hypothetical protein
MDVKRSGDFYILDALSFENLIFNINAIKGCLRVVYGQIGVFCGKEGVSCEKIQ